MRTDEQVAATLEDVSATALQRIARGVHAREYVRRLRGVYTRAATAIQGGARGQRDRRRVRRMRNEARAVIRIQVGIRGKLARLTYKREVTAAREAFAVSTITRSYRGLSGRRRMAHKRALVKVSRHDVSQKDW